jgi:uncharacterized membrane protein YdbT with pleckstrin-like domain
MDYIQKLLGKNERIALIKHRHWITWRPTLLLSLILIALITVGSLLFGSTLLPGFGYAGLLLNGIPLTLMLSAYLRWSNEQFIVTNRRIIQVDGIINKHTIDSSLDKINDVVLSQSFFGRMLGYGDLEILTGSEVGVNKLTCIQDPLEFKQAMLNAKESLRDAHTDSPNDARGTLTTSLEELNTLHQKGLITTEEFNTKRQKLLDQI